LNLDDDGTVRLDMFESSYMEKAHKIHSLIRELRSIFIENGGEPEDYPNYLAEQGVTVEGRELVVTGKFNTMAILRYA